MCRIHSRLHQVASLLTLGTLALIQSAVSPVEAQINLSPNQQYPQRPRATLDVGGGVRCSLEGGVSPSVSFSLGAYPDLIFGNAVINSTTSSSGQQSQLFALATLNIPLNQKANGFSCDQLLQDVQLRTRLQTLRELSDENILTETQFKRAVLEAYEKFAGQKLPPPSPINESTPTLVIPTPGRPAG